MGELADEQLALLALGMNSNASGAEPQFSNSKTTLDEREVVRQAEPVELFAQTMEHHVDVAWAATQAGLEVSNVDPPFLCRGNARATILETDTGEFEQEDVVGACTEGDRPLICEADVNLDVFLVSAVLN